MAPQIVIEGDGGYVTTTSSRHGRHYSDGGGHHRSHRRHGHHHSHKNRSRWRYICPCFNYRFRMHSTHRYRVASTAAVVAHVAAFVLFLLAAISLPIVKPIYLFQVQFNAENQPPTSIATNFRFGVWGFCASSALDAPTILTNNGECTKDQLGYTIPPDILSLSGYPPELSDAVVKTLTLLLVMHPISAGISLIALFLSLFLRSECMTILCLIATLISAVASSVVLAADLAIVLVAENKIKDALGPHVLDVTFGDAVWMIVAGVAMSWLGAILTSAIACRCCGIRRRHGWYDDGYHG